MDLLGQLESCNVPAEGEVMDSKTRKRRIRKIREFEEEQEKEQEE